MNDLAITIDGRTGAVTVTQTTRNGIALVDPPSITISADVWLETACALIMAGVNGRRQLNARMVNSARG